MYKSKYKKASSRIARRGKIRKFFSLFLKIAIPIAFLAGAIFILRADFLQVKNFNISGAETISSESVKSIASNFISGNQFFLIPKSNIIFLNKNKLAAALVSNFSRLEKVEINKDFFSRSITLLLTERKPDFLWCSPADTCFFMTKDGLIFEKSNLTGAAFEASKIIEAEPLNKTIFRGVLEGEPIMKNFATPERMQNYLKLIETFKTAGFEVSSINIESTDKAVAKTKIGDIIFDPTEADLVSVTQNTILLINEVKSKNPSAQFQYIDARFGNKFFYKLY